MLRAGAEAQFLQAQKMESLGRLAGGVAHDFNNLLTVVNGYSDLILRELNEEGSLSKKVMEIRKAGEKGAELTRQLLLQPAATDGAQTAGVEPADRGHAEPGADHGWERSEAGLRLDPGLGLSEVTRSR